MTEEPKLKPCPVCLCPGDPVAAADGGALFAHPGRMFACRVSEEDAVGWRTVALFEGRSQ